MSRRDTIILAVLLNTGLLAILFVIAVNPDSEHFLAPIESQQVLVERKLAEPAKESLPVILAQESRTDEVDNVLKDFAATMHLDNASTVAHSNRRHSFDDGMIAMHVESPTLPKAPLHREESSKEQYIEVTVKRGDILGRIAQANNATVDAIRKANDLTSDSLQVGQMLRIPIASSKDDSRHTRVPLAPVNDTSTRYYTIQSGDNPWKIAKKFNVSVRELLQLNDLDEAKAKNLRPGDRIRVQ